MMLLFEVGAYRVMCKHVELKKNTYYYRRRVLEDVRAIYKNLGKGKVVPLFFSLKTTDKAEACRKAAMQTRRLDALWQAHRERRKNAADPQISLAVVEAADLGPGDGVLYPDNPFLSVFQDMVIGTHGPDEPPPVVSAQDKLTLYILYGAPVPKLLSDAKDKYFALGKGPKGKVAKDQFDRAWGLLLEITPCHTFEAAKHKGDGASGGVMTHGCLQRSGSADRYSVRHWPWVHGARPMLAGYPRVVRQSPCRRPTGAAGSARGSLSARPRPTQVLRR